MKHNNHISAMNEEYFIYHRNAFSRFLHCIASVHQRLTEQEATHLLAKKSLTSDPEVRAMTARYNSDHERSLILRRIIRGLEASLAANVEKLNAPQLDDEETLVAENRSLRAALRRRNGELDRLNAAMEETYDYIDARLSETASHKKNRSFGCTRLLRFSAAASLL